MLASVTTQSQPRIRAADRKGSILLRNAGPGPARGGAGGLPGPGESGQCPGSLRTTGRKKRGQPRRAR
jgi:hypothetical protein